MHVVSSQSDREIERRRVEELAARATVELAANLLRIVRGAGKPLALIEQCERLVTTFRACDDVQAPDPSQRLHDWLKVGHRLRYDSSLPEHEVSFLIATDKMVAGSLQIAASRLLGQLTQEAAGDSQLHDGLRLYEDALAKMRVEWAAKPKPFSKRKARKPAQTHSNDEKGDAAAALPISSPVGVPPARSQRRDS